MRLILAVLIAWTIALPAPPANAQCPKWLPGPFDNGSGPIGVDGSLSAAVVWDPDGAGPLLERLVIGGSFTSVAGVPANNVAQWAPETGQWSALGNVFIPVSDLEVWNGVLYAGGGFADNNVGTFEEPVRRWDGSTWQPLPSTNTGTVTVLEVYNGSLYVGGSFMTHFTQQPDGPAHYSARWDPSTPSLWRAANLGFGTQTNTAVRALKEFNGDLYAGGNIFPSGEPSAVVHLTRGNPGTGWTALTAGNDVGSINDFTVFAGSLVIAGGFATVNGVTRNSMAGWNGSSFHGYSTGVGIGGVRCVTIHNGIAIGGAFTTASGSPANRTAFWPPGGSSWQALGSGMFDGSVEDLVSYRGQLIAVGTFDNAGATVNGIAHWDGATWGSFGGGIGNYILAMVPYNGRMVAGGDFHQPTASLSTAHNVAGWNGNTVSSFGVGTNGLVEALESFKYPGINGSFELIAGGSFTSAGGVAANRIARWNESPLIVFPPPAWQAMGGGFNNAVTAIERFNGVTYAGGFFNSPAGFVARWNESTDVWESMGSGLNGFVFAMKEYNGALYVGGNFSTAGGITARGLARWNGSSWSAVTGLFFDAIFALEVHDGKLVIGGQFSTFPGNPNICQFDGTTFTTFGAGGANNNVRALRSSGSRLYVGGDFTTLGGIPVNRFGYWDGSWHDSQFGTDGGVYALSSFGNEIMVGGTFANVDFDGTPPSILSPFWGRYSQTGTPWFTQHPFSQTVEIGSDVAFHALLANGFSGVTYQWFKDGLPLSNGASPWGSTITGAQTLDLGIADVLVADAGTYRIDVTNACGTTSSFPATLTVTRTVDAAPDLPGRTLFQSIGPNPTRGGSQVTFSLAADAAVQMRIYDISGRLVRDLDLGRLPAGQHRASWDARGNDGHQVAASIYVVRLAVDGRTIGTRRLAVLR